MLEVIHKTVAARILKCHTMEKKLREATYTAAVCRFREGTFFCFLFGSECGTAQFSLFLFPLFSCFSICPPWRIMWPLLYCRSGQFLVWFISECGTAQLSLSLFFLFSCATADIVIDVDGLDNILPSWSSSTSTSMTIIFSPNQRPRKCDMTERRTETHFDIITTNAVRAAAIKLQTKTKNLKLEIVSTQSFYHLAHWKIREGLKELTTLAFGSTSAPSLIPTSRSI